jgi:hypothetical protein
MCFLWSRHGYCFSRKGSLCTEQCAESVVAVTLKAFMLVIVTGQLVPLVDPLVSSPLACCRSVGSLMWQPRRLCFHHGWSPAASSPNQRWQRLSIHHHGWSSAFLTPLPPSSPTWSSPQLTGDDFTTNSSSSIAC